MNAVISRPDLPGLCPGDHPLPAPHPLQGLEVAMLRIGLGGLRQQISQQTIRDVLRPPHRLRNPDRLLDQTVNDLLGRGNSWRWG
jgi:hypothetical protein